MTRILFSLAALTMVTASEVQTFKHIGDHAPHTHEHKPSGRKAHRSTEIN